MQPSEAVSNDPEAVVSEWIDAFNVRDLDGMLERMDPDVRFYPLRLSGMERSYRRHDGIRAWFARLAECGHEHLISVSRLRRNGEDEVQAIGELHLVDGSDPEPFWGQSRIEDGLIAIHHHYLTPPGILKDVAPGEPRRRKLASEF